MIKSEKAIMPCNLIALCNNTIKPHGFKTFTNITLLNLTI